MKQKPIETGQRPAANAVTIANPLGPFAPSPACGLGEGPWMALF